MTTPSTRPEIIMLVGVSGSGKSTVRKTLVVQNPQYRVLNIDEMRDEYTKQHGLTFQQLFEPEHHAWSHQEFERQLKLALEQGKDVIIDRTNIKEEDRRRILDLVPATYKKTAVYFHCTKSEVMQRQAKRDAQLEAGGGLTQRIPEAIIDQMLADYKQPNQSEGFDVVYSAEEFMEHCTQDNLLKKTKAGFHYSGYDHRPYDYSTKHPDELTPEFKQSRFAASLTNVNPRHYPQSEKDRLYTLEFAEHALAAGDISAPKDKTVLWSGGYIPGHPLGYGLGRITAERWLSEKNHDLEASGKPYHEIKNQLYHTVAMTEAGLPVLNPMWDDHSVAMETKWKVTPTYIIGFAKTARGEITLNVDDTDIDSFFRQNELDVVMKNPDITSVRVVRVDPKTDKLVETLYPNRQSWYEDQKDQWVDSITTRFDLAATAHDKELMGHKLFGRMTGALAEEVYDSYRNLTQGNPLLDFSNEADREQSLNRERTRLKKFASVVVEHPEILDSNKIPSEHGRTALKQFFSKICADLKSPSEAAADRESKSRTGIC